MAALFTTKAVQAHGGFSRTRRQYIHTSIYNMCVACCLPSITFSLFIIASSPCQEMRELDGVFFLNQYWSPSLKGAWGSYGINTRVVIKQGWGGNPDSQHQDGSSGCSRNVLSSSRTRTYFPLEREKEVSRTFFLDQGEYFLSPKRIILLDRSRIFFLIREEGAFLINTTIFLFIEICSLVNEDISCFIKNTMASIITRFLLIEKHFIFLD